MDGPKKNEKKIWPLLFFLIIALNAHSNLCVTMDKNNPTKMKKKKKVLDTSEKNIVQGENSQQQQHDQQFQQ